MIIVYLRIPHIGKQILKYKCTFTSTIDSHYGDPKGLKIPFSHRCFAQIIPRNCLKFTFTPGLRNHSGCQIDLSRNKAILFIQFSLSRFEICLISHHTFLLGGASLIFAVKKLIIYKKDSHVSSLKT